MADHTATIRANNKAGNPSWIKGGASPNPSGRPAVAEETRLSITKKALQYCPEAMDTIYELMLNAERETTKLKAAEMILDRGIGKPVPIEAPALSAEDVLRILPTLTAGQTVYQHPEDAANGSSD